MKTKVIILALALGASTCLLTAQTGDPPRAGQRPPLREGGPGGQRGGSGAGESETLTEAQKSQVKAILSKYVANTLTADQAKAIHEAFRQAGLRGGPAMADAIKAAGFDPDKLRDLAPPPGQANGGNEPQPRGEGKQTPGSGARPEPGGKQAGGQGGDSIEQAISDRAQLNTNSRALPMPEVPNTDFVFAASAADKSDFVTDSSGSLQARN